MGFLLPQGKVRFHLGGHACNFRGGGGDTALWLAPLPAASKRAQLTGPQYPTENDAWDPEVTRSENADKMTMGFLESAQQGVRKVIICHVSGGGGGGMTIFKAQKNLLLARHLEEGGNKVIPSVRWSQNHSPAPCPSPNTQIG